MNAARRQLARASAEPRPGPARRKLADVLEEAERWTAQLGVVQASVNRMNGLGSIADIGQAIVEETRRIIDYHNCRVYVVEPPDQVVPIAFRGEVGTYDEIPMELLRTTLGSGFTGWVALHGEPLLISDANADSRGATIEGTDDVDESMVVVPMKRDAAVVGVITLSKLGLDQFDERDLRLMTILADAAATAIGSARALEESRQMADRLGSLLGMASDLARSLDPRQVADLIARHMTVALGVDETAISYLDTDADTVLSWGYYPVVAPGQLQPSFRLADFPETRRVLDEQTPSLLRVDDPDADAAEVAFLRSEGFAAQQMLPLVAHGRSIGLVELFSRTPMTLDASRLELATAMAHEAAMSLENARLYEAARSLADRDPLTEFYNHRYLHERLGEELLRAQRSRRPVALLMIDLDDFKLVNDTLGHQVGDQVLRWTADLIRSALRATDVPARYGGDEFAVILPETDLATARVAAERIVAAFAGQTFQAAQRGSVPMGVSIGLASAPLDGRTARELVGAADAALYRSKRSGGGRVLASTSASEDIVTPTDRADGAAGVDAQVASVARPVTGLGLP